MAGTKPVFIVQYADGMVWLFLLQNSGRLDLQDAEVVSLDQELDIHQFRHKVKRWSAHNLRRQSAENSSTRLVQLAGGRPDASLLFVKLGVKRIQAQIFFETLGCRRDWTRRTHLRSIGDASASSATGHRSLR